MDECGTCDGHNQDKDSCNVCHGDTHFGPNPGDACDCHGNFVDPQCPCGEYAVTLPDGTSDSGDVLVMTAANGRQCGGGQQVAPRACLNDGKLDFLIVHDVDMQSFGQVLREILTLDNEANQYVSYMQAESMKMEWWR